MSRTATRKVKSPSRPSTSSSARSSARPTPHKNASTDKHSSLPGQAVLVLQGGGALGAFHVGVYQALHKAGIEPDWVIGTSIGAINGAIIAGNRPEHRLERLHAFWEGVQQHAGDGAPPFFTAFGQTLANMSTITKGIPGFFTPSPTALLGNRAQVGIDHAAYYSTQPLRETLTELVDLDFLNSRHTRLTVGAVNARNGEMRYFDSRKETIEISHIMASGALPPAFPAVRIDGEPYWDGGLYSNTPIEAVLDDNPRRDSIIFTANLWNPDGPEPASLWEVTGREKDIQYASRATSHIARQQQIHHLRHIIRELAQHVPQKDKSAVIKELASWGCGTTMHVVPLTAPAREGEDQLKDIDFTPAGIEIRRDAGLIATTRALRAAPWKMPVDPMEGVVIHHRN